VTRLGAAARLACAGLVAVLFGAPANARAQDVSVTVQLPREVIAEIQDALRAVTHDTLEAIGGAAREVHFALPEIERALREIERFGQRQGGTRGRQTARETRSVQVPRGGMLEVRHVSGLVTIVAGSSNQVELVLEHSGRTPSAGRTRAGGQGGVLRVTERGNRTIVEGPADAAYDATLTIKAPASTNISITTITAEVRVTGMQGALSVESAIGDITIRDCGRLTGVKTMTGDIEVRGVDHDGTLDASAINGSLTMDRVHVRQLSADTVSGEIHATGVRAATVDVTSMAGEVSFAGELQRGGRYEFHSHNGEMELIFTGAGYSLDATTVRGRVEIAAQLGLRAATRTPQAVRGVVGDGSATVEATAFNSQITIRGRK
jgi:hypothetical protein